ncbi:signal peptidase II [Gudongella oleilytica]|uniref:signal peptidase II n=1 Tax=Gudongella oleilytica TaxID=1582259 RepID=UPI000EDCAAF7|nr:signal peptidase II [Gudongella oleilytica]MDY0256946.1 signal peptidase II [Gudongella oleilytica]HCO19219.1 signal peptidase II [Tissierellales bacterium]
MGLILSIFIILADQITKSAATQYLMGQRPIEIIKNFVELHYVKNYGAAFGILQNQRWFFIVITSIVVFAMVVYMLRNSKNITILTKLSISMLSGGAVGNLIDRVRLGYVVDFIKLDLKIYNFPVFNIADIFIVVGTALLVYTVLFDKLEKKAVDRA